MAFWHRVTVRPGETVEFRLRLTRYAPGRAMDLGAAFTQTQADRKRAPNEYYAAAMLGRNERRRGDGDVGSLSGTWSLQSYRYDVAR
jgi:hypothetical protein